jgi:hypothetical protein
MGFNKRFVSEETIMVQIKNKEKLSKLFKADAFIFLDKFSTEVYTLFNEGIEDKLLIKMIQDGKIQKD